MPLLAAENLRVLFLENDPLASSPSLGIRYTGVCSAFTPATVRPHSPVCFSLPKVTTLTAQLHTHALYGAVRTPAALRIFAEHHVFAVWDFMSLLKSLQRSLTCVTVPWMPPASGRIARLINEIVLGEESDTMPTGDSTSHFEPYCGAMHEVGGKHRVDRFVSRAAVTRDVADRRAHACTAPTPVVPFVQTTFTITEMGRTHAIAAAFALGRKDLVP